MPAAIKKAQAKKRPAMKWSRRFERPIEVPKGAPLKTLADARTYVLKLPKAKQQLPHWQGAAHNLLIVAQGAQMMLAEAAVRRALIKDQG